MIASLVSSKNAFAAGGFFLLAASAFGCAGEGTAPAATDEDLRGGKLAFAAAYDAVGILGHQGADGKAVTGCTGTLIGPKTVITAKHCVRDEADGSDNRIEEGLVFFVGTTASKWTQKSKVLSAKVAPSAPGGYIGYGSDVAVLTLESELKGIRYARTASTLPMASMVGKPMFMVGFGFNQNEVDGVRRMGNLTLRATAGRPLELIFKTLPKFLAFAAKAEKDPAIANSVDDRAAMAAYAYNYGLLQDQEAFVGLGSADAQPCRNDSGAPVLLEDAKGLVVWAVASGSLKLSDKSCGNYGSFVATLGPSVQPLLEGTH